MPRVIRITPALALALASTTAMADGDLMTRNTLTGDWGGLRHQLEEDGIRFTGDYSGETAYNAHGGLHRSARYSQNLKLGVQFDLRSCTAWTMLARSS